MGSSQLNMLVTIVTVICIVGTPVSGMPISEIRQIAARYNVSGVFVFGDSSVDPGNNNGLNTDDKSNFPPYGIDFFGGHPTGRFSNGRLATDFIAEALGYTKAIRPFLEPRSTMPFELSHGVSFASSGSGYDNLTAQISNVLTLSHQLKYFAHYKRNLTLKIGAKRTTELIQNAVFVLSMGTNDFLQNYYVEPTRSAQYTVDQYGDYLISLFLGYVKKMHSLGARRLVVVGMVPFGCMPLVRTMKGTATKCDDHYNNVALSFNTKIKKALVTLKRSLGMKTVYADAYDLIQDAIQNPQKYGFVETSKGCCGTGTYEYGISCKGMDACADRDKYLFWDAVHPTAKMYKIVADGALSSIITNIFQ
ncbi:GDSL esterase/lipase At5g45950-like [Bidens hawaiensis]|uniref:GDSL esterase/lipase At5g45950-like n=1 Tax=Bidens hawaiensis TaxID=980011 RepID=UPI00404B339B